jgi:hypothetical protein
MRMAEYLCRYGEEAVNSAGIAALGYPGLWITEISELTRIKLVLTKQK